MNKILAQLKSFAEEDKYIQAEIELALFELFGIPMTIDQLKEAISDIFYSWYLLMRDNSHYKMAPLQAAQKFQPENFATDLIAMTDIFLVADDPSKLVSHSSGLVFSADVQLPQNEAIGGIFLQSGQNVIHSYGTKTFKKIEADQYKTILGKTDWFKELFAKEFAEQEKKKIADLIRFEDMLNNTFTALSINDLSEVDITDGLEEFEHPNTLLEKVKSEAEVFPESASGFFLTIFQSLQEILEIDPAQVKEPETGVSDEQSDEMQIMLDQMMGQFTDPDQKLFFGDFLDFVKENQVDAEGMTQEQMAQRMGQLEQKWKSMPRENLGGITPEEFREKNPHVDKSSVKTVRREEPKVGRNDPCPCGSGKKYKKCHGKNV